MHHRGRRLIQVHLRRPKLRPHIQTVLLNGILVVTLDVDGMLQTKRTTRESDIPDRLKLERLENAMRERARNMPPDE